MSIGLLGQKIGMTSVYDANGRLRPVTVIAAGDNVVLRRITAENNGYSAVQVGFGRQKESRLSKQLLGEFKKAGAGGGFFKKMLGTASNSPLLAKGQIVSRNNPLEAIKIAEEILNSDPKNSMAHKLLADAALAADLPRTAVLSLEILHNPLCEQILNNCFLCLSFFFCTFAYSFKKTPF